jgi:hypothetical protein
MVPAIDLHAIEAQLASASAEVRLAPVQSENVELATKHVEVYLKSLSESRDRFDRLAARVVSDTRTICEADQFYTLEEREILGRVEALFREWAPKFAGLRAPEFEPFVRAFPAWFRPYNDALTHLVRTLVDCAAACRARLDDEASEDADAEEWAERKQPLPSDDELVSWTDVRSRLYPNGH